MTTTLLAVDDSKTMRKVLEITFAGEDYKVVLAESAQQALEKLRSERPTVVLLDAHVGSDSGYDLCQQLKREAPGVGVLILSSKQQPYDKARGAAVGADEFMDKPFDTQQLIDKTAALVRRLAEQPAAAPKPAVAAAPPPAPAPAAPAARPPAAIPAVTPRPAVPAAPAPQAARPHVQTLVGGQQPAPAAPAPAATPAPAPVAAAMGGNGQFAEKLAGLGLTKDQIAGVLALSRDVVEQVVWEVVPQLAETIIKEEIRRLTSE